jgi:S-methylmethionine-dependent homocysteine/selenocysteine methylase
MSDGWLRKLRDGDIVLMDGGTGSELRRRGVAMSPQAWSGPAARADSDMIEQIHADYIRAGAEIVTTNTFATTRFVLDAAGLGEEFTAINRRAVEAARRAREKSAVAPVAIAGSISCLPPRFDVRAYPPPPTERDGYRELAELLAQCGADLLVLEMMEDDRHAPMAIEAALEVGLPVCVGVSVRLDRNGRLTSFDVPDTPLERVMHSIVPLRPALISVMHTAPSLVPRALAEVNRLWDGPLGAYPLPGDPDAAEPRRRERPPQELARLAVGWVQHGARLLGGCCGTTPAHIRALREALPRLRRARRACPE